LHNQARQAAPRCPIHAVNNTRGYLDFNSLNSRAEQCSVAAEVQILNKLLAVTLAKLAKEEPCIFLPIVFKMERLFACRNQLTACILPGNFNLSLELFQIGPLFTLKGLAYLGASFQKTYYWQLLLGLTCPQPFPNALL
jgi:hypothetical protein